MRTETAVLWHICVCKDAGERGERKERGAV